MAAPLEHLHSATVAAFVKAGSRYEDEASNGLSHFLEHMMFRGTEPHPSAYELNLAIEELGATLEAETHADYTAYSTTLPPENVDAALELFGEIFRAPVFRDLEVEKRIIREEILEDLDEDGNEIDVDNLARELLFSPHPLGQKITGSIDNVERFDVSKLREHMRRFYGARNMVLCVAGAVEPEAVLERAARQMGGLPPGSPVSATPPDTTAGQRFRYAEDPGSQTNVRLSFPTPGLHDERHTALQLMARVLDDGLSSRVHHQICDRRGLAYEAFASLESYEDGGVLDLGASVAHGKAPQVTQALLQLARELCDERVPDRELERARQRSLWDMRATLDDAEELAWFYGTSTLLGLHEDLESRAAHVGTVTPEQVREVARHVFAPGAARLTCVGMLGRGLREAAQDELQRHG